MCMYLYIIPAMSPMCEEGFILYAYVYLLIYAKSPIEETPTHEAHISTQGAVLKKPSKPKK